MTSEVLAARDLSKTFYTRQGQVKAVSGVTYSIAEQETLALVGESGSGKSTSAYVVAGVYPPSGGTLHYRGTDIAKVSRKRTRDQRRGIQMVFQDPGSSLNPRQAIGRIIALPLLVHTQIRGSSLRAKVEAALELVGLPAEYQYKYPRSVGGGEKQLVSIARSMVADPSLTLLDEPTSALDVSMQARILHLLSGIQRDRSVSYLFITHDLSVVRNFADTVAIMYLGRIYETASTEVFFTHPHHPYTRMLMSSIPVITAEEEAMLPAKGISRGEIPSPVDIPPGCGFQTRCLVASEVCLRQEAELQEREPGHWVRCHFGPAAESGERRAFPSH